MSTEHPFIHTYPIQNVVDASKVDSIINFVRDAMGVGIESRPSVWMVGHDHMQHAAQRVFHYKTDHQVMGWFSRNHPDKVFISDRLKIRNVRHAAVLAHEVTHFFQCCTNDDREMDLLEQDADRCMNDYLRHHG